MATQRILDFLATRRPSGPCLVVDLDVVRDNFRAFEKALPDSKIYYAVKANPAPEILRLLAAMGSSFDTASVAEVEMAMDAGAPADRISFGNTIKKERDIARAYQLGIRLFAVDCVEEVEKIARVAPGARVFCRVLTDGEGAEWPLSRKFGCVPAMAVDVLRRARELGLDAYGVSFHVGSQQTDLAAWDRALGGRAPSFLQAGDYSAAKTYLEAVKATGTDDQYARALQAPLPGLAHLRQQQVPRITVVEIALGGIGPGPHQRQSRRTPCGRSAQDRRQTRIASGQQRSCRIRRTPAALADQNDLLLQRRQ